MKLSPTQGKENDQRVWKRRLLLHRQHPMIRSSEVVKNIQRIASFPRTQLLPSWYAGDAFSKCLQSEEREAIPVHFDVAVPFCPQSYEVRVCGESSALGDGKAENGVLLRRSPHKRWSGMVEVPLSHFPLT